MGAQEVVEPTEKRTRRTRKEKAPAVTKVTATDAKKSAIQTLDIVSRMGVFLAGHPAAEMQAEEKESIAKPLAGMYQRAPEVSENVARWTDPITLLIAMGMYLLRVTMVQRQVKVAMAAQLAQQQAGAHAPDIQTVRDATETPPAEPVDYNRTGRTVTDLDNLSRLG